MGYKLGRTYVSMVDVNCYFVYDENGHTVVFDPGAEGQKIYEKLGEKGLKVSGIVLTHGHYDHILGVAALKDRSGCRVYAPEPEEEILTNTGLNLSSEIGRPCTVKADQFLKDGEICDIDGIRFKTLLTPGHTKGSACYYFEEDKMLISGDTLFEGSVGRSDLPTGNMGELINSIRKKLMTLPEDVKVYPGHGNDTTIGDEKKYNPFC